MTKRERLYCVTCLLGAIAAYLASASLASSPACPSLFAQARSSQPTDFPNRDGQWVRGDASLPVALESDETDDTEELSDREKACESSGRHCPDASRQATLTAASRQPKLLITLNALRVRLQI
ncbi:MAG TPA: hypothetical protein VNH11_19490 [Pirellulales bacterium]|nr:hypothetical protein [Pirellulales bacterium]